MMVFLARIWSRLCACRSTGLRCWVLQGGPHNHTIAGLAVALKQAASEDFKAYQTQVLQNTSALADRLLSKGHTLVSGGAACRLALLIAAVQARSPAAVAACDPQPKLVPAQHQA